MRIDELMEMKFQINKKKFTTEQCLTVRDCPKSTKKFNIEIVLSHFYLNIDEKRN